MYIYIYICIYRREEGKRDRSAKCGGVATVSMLVQSWLFGSVATLVQHRCVSAKSTLRRAWYDVGEL